MSEDSAPRKEVPPIPPPVPPQCDLFWKWGENGYWWITLGGNSYSLHPDSAGFIGAIKSDRMKRVAACVAAQYWHIEYNRLIQESESSLCDIRKNVDQRHECKQNAERWLAWGGLAPQKGEGA
jgi:hypothetical protein